jgi:NADPH:quinone reductase-like Zn-dependent oxidoreductase
MQTARISQTETVLPGGQVLVAGGKGFAGHVATQLSSAELYTP